MADLSTGQLAALAFGILIVFILVSYLVIKNAVKSAILEAKEDEKLRQEVAGKEEPKPSLLNIP